jgi:3-dehydroquinate synthase
MQEIGLSLPGQDRSYRLLVGPGLGQKLGQLLQPLAFPKKIVLISDRRVARYYGASVVQALVSSGYQPALLTVAPGERSKTWAVVQRLAGELLSLGVHRQTPLLALGGGVVGDLTGFLASIFMRGLPCVQIPTTLLAMVDAAIGGKTAVDLPQGKNLLGTFHQPRIVVIDPRFLQTLPAAERLNGMAEVVKAGFIRDPGLLTHLEQLRLKVFGDEEALTALIYRAAAIKAEVVAADEREGGLRRILNFGHTLGHALEAAARFRLPHGRAVAWGMVAALRLSAELTNLPEAEAQRGISLITDLGLTRRSLPPLDPEVVLAALTLDKKRQEGGVPFVLLRCWGETVIQEQVPISLLKQAINDLLAR